MSLTRGRVLIHEFITGGGLAGRALPASLAAEGAAMRRAAALDFASLAGLQVIVTLDERLADDPGPWETRRIEPGAHDAILPRLAADCDATLLVAPESDGVLERLTRLLERVGARTLGSDAPAIAAAGDKWAAARVLAAAGIPHPPTRLVDATDRLALPCVLKPRDGAGSIDTHLVREASDRPARFPWPGVAQPFVDGAPMSASFLVGPDGRARLVGVGRQRVERRGSRLVYRGGIVPAGAPALAETARRAAESFPGLRGWVGVDFNATDDGLCVILDVNPRLTTSFVGLRTRLPAGTLARAWIGLLGGDASAADGLARQVHAAPAVRFAPEGAIDREGGDP
jgi:predicted ATP-grasp superfamily ATP-dependent carboligase